MIQQILLMVHHYAVILNCNWQPFKNSLSKSPREVSMIALLPCPLYQEFITQPPDASVSLFEKCCSYPSGCICVPSCVWLFATSWTPAFQAPLSMEFSTQEYWNGLPFPTPEDLPDVGIKSVSPALTDRFGFFSLSHLGRPSPKTRGTKITPVVITLISHCLKISSWCNKKKNKGINIIKE